MTSTTTPASALVKRVATPALVLGLFTACETATDVELVTIDVTGAIVGQVYLDLNGSGDLDIGDPGFNGATIRILAAGTGEELLFADTDSVGRFSFPTVPVGQYGLAIEPDLRGDSLVYVEPAPALLTVDAMDSVTTRVGLAFPTVTLAEAQQMTSGRRVFTHGIALNARAPFGDGVVHIADGSRYLMMTDVERSALSVGDSVRVLGRTSSTFGSPILDDVTPTVLIASATVPLPEPVSSLQASLAGSGSLDAALVIVEDAVITDVAVDGGGRYFVTIDDGSGSVDIQIPTFLGVDDSLLEPGNLVPRATGLLRPTSGGTWDLFPRGSEDLVILRPEESGGE